MANETHWAGFARKERQENSPIGRVLNKFVFEVECSECSNSGNFYILTYGRKIPASFYCNGILVACVNGETQKQGWEDEA